MLNSTSPLYQPLEQVAADRRHLAALLAFKPDRELLGTDRVRRPKLRSIRSGPGGRNRSPPAEKTGQPGASLSCPPYP
jgi:hypothetical protein